MNRKPSFFRIAMLLCAGGALVGCDNTAMVGESDVPGSGGVTYSNGGSGIPLPLFVGGMVGTGGSGGVTGAGGVAGDTGGGGGGTLGLVGTSCVPISFASGFLNPCGHAWAVAYSADGQWLATSGTWNGGDLHLWRTSDGSPVRTIVAHGNTYGVDFSPDGKLLASAGQGDGLSGMVKLWNVSTGALVRTIPVTLPTGMSNYASGVAFSPDGTLLATSAQGPVELWKVADGTRVRSLASTNTVYQVRFSLDGTRLIAAGVDGATARVWSVSSGAVLLDGLVTGMDQASADFSPDGKLIASNGPDGTVIIRDAATGGLLQTMGGHSVMMGRVVWVDQNRLLSNDWDGTVILWARDATGTFVALQAWLVGGAGAGASTATSIGMAVSPDGRHFVTGGLAGSLGGFVFNALP